MKPTVSDWTITVPKCDVVNYTECIWTGPYMVNNTQDMPAVYSYRNGCLGFIGNLPHRSPLMRIMRGYAWLIGDRQCTICKVEPRVVKLNTVAVADVDDMTFDNTTKWFIIRIMYAFEKLSDLPAFDGTQITGRGNIRAIICVLSGGAAEGTSRMRLVSTQVGYGTVLSYDEYGVLYRDSVTSESVHIWRPGTGIYTFRPCDMLIRPSNSFAEFTGQYSVAVHHERIAYICAQGYLGAVFVDTFSGVIRTEEYSSQLVCDSLYLGDRLCQIEAYGRRLVDVTDYFTDLTPMLTTFCKDRGEIFAGVTICGSNSLLCVHTARQGMCLVEITHTNAKNVGSDDT